MSEDDGGDEINDRISPDEDRIGNRELFGDYAVLSPGVHIILDGRPVSRPG